MPRSQYSQFQNFAREGFDNGMNPIVALFF